MIASNHVIVSALNSVASWNNKNTREYQKFSLPVKLKSLSNYKSTMSTLEDKLILNLLPQKISHCNWKFLVLINICLLKEVKKAFRKICRFRSLSCLTMYAFMHIILRNHWILRKYFWGPGLSPLTWVL